VHYNGYTYVHFDLFVCKRNTDHGTLHSLFQKELQRTRTRNHLTMRSSRAGSQVFPYHRSVIASSSTSQLVVLAH
ncbi:hypothetical protein BD779DRAFT_1560749, partial [Infundibulicybe gibba]